VGFTFWRDSLQRVLHTVECALARWCLLELNLDDEALRHLVGTEDWTDEAETVTGASLDNRVDRSAYARIWGKWRGREQEFFGRCAELVSPLQQRHHLVEEPVEADAVRLPRPGADQRRRNAFDFLPESFGFLQPPRVALVVVEEAGAEEPLGRLVRAGMDAHGILVFRDQPFADPEQLALTWAQTFKFCR
jgi:hypothetical protein